jgi:DNA polymerase-3 subunit epsilon
MREIVLDTETTGFDPLQGDRMIEIGCVEIVNHLPTGKIYHQYFNPERDVPDAAVQVHGITNAFLEDKPLFLQEVDAFLDFIGDAPLVIHNAPFDMGFINAELTRAGYKGLPMSRAVDTLPMARRIFPGAPASLDALCKRFGIDLSDRGFHGAYLDARLLAEVYLELKGGRQPGLDMLAQTSVSQDYREESETRIFREPRAHTPSSEEEQSHTEFLLKIKKPLWSRAD